MYNKVHIANSSREVQIDMNGQLQRQLLLENHPPIIHVQRGLLHSSWQEQLKPEETAIILEGLDGQITTENHLPPHFTLTDDYELPSDKYRVLGLTDKFAFNYYGISDYWEIISRATPRFPECAIANLPILTKKILS